MRQTAPLAGGARRAV